MKAYKEKVNLKNMINLRVLTMFKAKSSYFLEIKSSEKRIDTFKPQSYIH